MLISTQNIWLTYYFYVFFTVTQKTQVQEQFFFFGILNLWMSEI